MRFDGKSTAGVSIVRNMLSYSSIGDPHLGQDFLASLIPAHTFDRNTLFLEFRDVMFLRAWTVDLSAISFRPTNTLSPGATGAGALSGPVATTDQHRHLRERVGRLLTASALLGKLIWNRITTQMDSTRAPSGQAHTTSNARKTITTINNRKSARRSMPTLCALRAQKGPDPMNQGQFLRYVLICELLYAKQRMFVSPGELRLVNFAQSDREVDDKVVE